MICDACGKCDSEGFNDFRIDHKFGVDSPFDESSVTAAICDRCLMTILLDRVDGAAFTDMDGNPLSGATMRAGMGLDPTGYPQKQTKNRVLKD